jgi:PAS domain S-box-containing protein
MSDVIAVLYIGVDPGPPETDVQREGFCVLIPEDGEDVPGIIEDTDVDCVVSEHCMPRLDGLELLEEVRKEYPDVPFVLFAQNGSEEVASEAISEGVTDYVQKKGEESYGRLLDSVRNAVEEHRTERELRESEQRYSTLVENANAGVFILQGDEVKFVNSRCAEIFGAEKQEMIGKDPKELIAPEDRQRAMDMYRRRLRGEDVSGTHEDRILTVDGESKHIEVNASVITYEGEPASLAVVRDITERKGRERELERQNERLEEFASVVSHDLRNPLTVAKGQIELGMRGRDKENFEKAYGALERMDDLIDDVLTLAREGQRVTEKREADLRSIAKKGWERRHRERAPRGSRDR